MYKYLGVLLFSFSSVFAFAEDYSSGKVKTIVEKEKVVEDTIVAQNAKRVQVMRLDTIDNTDFLGRVTVSGQARFNMIYRNMSESYADMVTADKNLAFTDYPVTGTGTSNSSGQPFIDLVFNMKPSKNFSFDIGYAMYHGFNGETVDSLSRSTTIRSNLNFAGRLSTDYGLFRIKAGGGVLWSQMSPLTISGLEPRRDNFDRLPWDWYNNSWSKYSDFFNASVNLGSESYGNQALQGFQVMGDGLPGNFGFTMMYGRSNQSIDQALADFFPSSLTAFRLYNYIGNAKVGVNVFNQKNYETTYSDVVDSREIGSVDVEYMVKGIRLYGEFGMGRVRNRGVELLTENGIPSWVNEENLKPNGDWGEAVILNATIPESVSKFPINIGLYRVSHEVASNISSVYNSNITAPGRGLQDELTYQTSLFVNQMTDIGNVANNRQGGSISTGRGYGKFHFELGYALSQELENKYNVVTFSHKAFAFSRSRFNPWVFEAGPYKRVQNSFRAANERVNITDINNGVDVNYKKGFTNIDFSAKYKTSLLGKGLIFKWYNSLASATQGLSILPNFSDNAFLSSYYTQLIGFYNLSKKVQLVAMVEMEQNKANDRTELSDYNRKSIDQLGQGYGYGVDYDFSDFAGIYFRHRFMQHDDINFIKDRFKGQEMTVELKVFF